MVQDRTGLLCRWCALLLFFALSLSGCGFGPGADIPSGSITSKGASASSASLTVTPATATVTTGAPLVLSASASNLSKPIQWTATAGAISGTGTTVTYTAPINPGTYTATATSGTLSSASTITVVAATPAKGESISVSPATASLVAGGTLVLTATLQGTPNNNVIWTATAGTVTGTSTTGTYTAPGTAGTYTITATTSDGTVSASCIVNVSPPPPPPPPSPEVTLTISPTAVSIPAGTDATFSATITGTSNTNVLWSANGGTVTGTGLSVIYTAPSTPGTYTLSALSLDPSGAAGNAIITVTPAVAPPPPTQVTVSVSPASATIANGSTLILVATVSGTTNTTITWTATSGTIIGSGTTATYIAPATGSGATIVATSGDPSGASGSATLTFTAPPTKQSVTITMLPTQQTMPGGTTQSFTATVSGAVDTSVTWSATGGTISGTGSTITYTAPLIHGSYTITATANADPNQTAFATVTVPAPTLSVSPSSWTMGEGGVQTFTATVTNTNATGVSWTATAGSIPATGNSVTYTAPNAATTVIITATSLADPSVKTTATVNVVASKRPIISNVHATATTNSCTVTWNTDVGADSLLDLGTGAGPYIPGWSQLDAVTTDTNSPGVTSHTASITGLMPGLTYNIYLRSRPFVGGVVDTSVFDTGWYDGTSNCNNLHDGSVCSCGNNAVPTLPATKASGSTYDFQIQLAGAFNVVQSYGTYLWINYADIARPSSGFLSMPMDVTITGLPPNSTVTTYDPAGFVVSWNPATGLLKLNPSSVAQDTALHIVTTGSTPLGTYPITFNAHSEQYPAVTHTYTFNLNVINASFPFGTPASFPPIPGIGTPATTHTWLWGMMTKGSASLYCSAGSTGLSTSANFYDGIRAYQQVKAYDIANGITGNPSQWDTCLANRENGYVLYVNSTSPPGQIFAIFLASKGMANLALNGDTTAQAALFNTADHAQWHSMRPSLMDVGLGRELNFTTEAFKAANLAGDPNEAASIQVGLDFLLGDIDRIVNNNASHALFLDGTFADTLIHYYEDTGSTDVRVPMAIKALADHIWVNYWIPGGCSGATQQVTACFFYTAGQAHMGIDYATNGTGQNDADSNLLIAPMYAWLFKMTGDGTIPGSDGSQCLLGGGVPGQPCTYQQAGDSIFLSGVKQDDYFAVKEWNQAFRWSFDYVTWRSP